MEFFAIAGGISVHISDTGRQNVENLTKKPILLLHGYLETLYIWSEFTELLSATYRVISIDLPGHGLSDSAPRNEEGISINTMDFCAAVAREVLQKCGVRNAVIGGHSMGGYVALSMAKHYPEVCEKLVLFNSNPFCDKPEKAVDRKREIEIIRSGKLSSLAAVSIPNMYSPENLRLLDDKVKETVELCETHYPEGIIASLLGMMQREDMQDFFRSGAIPILMLCGDQDLFMPLEILEELKRKSPSVSFCILPGSGHNSFIEKKEESFQQVSGFIG